MHENKVRIKAVAHALREFSFDLYFVGGAVVSFYADNERVFEHRPTDDIDVVVEILTRGKYFQAQELLKEMGLTEDVNSKVICRWKYQGITIDIMPLNPDILGFSNRWYSHGIKNSIDQRIDDLTSVQIFSFPCFLATKLEALNNRNVDWRYSKDFEDIIKVLESRGRAIDDIDTSNIEIKRFIIQEFKKIKTKERFLIEAIDAILYPNQSEYRTNKIMAKIDHIIAL